MSVIPINKIGCTPSVFFTPEAWMKLLHFANETKTECAVHGTVIKADTNKYIVTDLFAYPQLVQAAFVTTDDAAYVKWLENLSDETINGIRFQCHSHVNMSPTPSGVDWTTYGSFINNVDDYYIFMVINKSEKYSLMLYDVAQNLMYDKEDLITGIITSTGALLTEWYTQQETLIKKPEVVKASPFVLPATKGNKKPETPKIESKPYQYTEEDDIYYRNHAYQGESFQNPPHTGRAQGWADK